MSINWIKRKEGIGQKLDTLKQYASTWEASPQLERKKKSREETWAIVISSSSIISPLGKNKTEHTKAFLDWTYAPLHRYDITPWGLIKLEGWSSGEREVSLMWVNEEILEIKQWVQANAKKINLRITNWLLSWHLALMTSKEAITNSLLSQEQIANTHLILASWDLSNLNTINSWIQFSKSIPKRWMDVVKGMASSTASWVSILNWIHAGHTTVSNACASFNTGLNTAADKILLNEDRVILTSTDSVRHLTSATAFKIMWTLWTHSSPFDKSADWFIPSEGSATYVLERALEAQKRWLTPDLELLWWAETSDADINLANPNNKMQIKCMLDAIYLSWLRPDQIDWVVTHWTSTWIWDPAEALSIAAVFWDHKPVIMAPKSNAGHQIWNSWALWLECASTALNNNQAPKIIWLNDPIPEAENLNLSTWAKWKFKYILVNAFGFWWINTSFIVKKYESWLVKKA